MQFTLRSRVLFTTFWGQRIFLSNLTPGWPLVDPSWTLQNLWTINALHSSQEFFLPNLTNLTPDWPKLAPAWPLTPSVHCTLVKGSSCQIWWLYGAFLSKFTLIDLGWPFIWPLTSGIRYTSVRGSSKEQGISKAIRPLDDLWPLVGSLRKLTTNGGPLAPISYHPTKFQLDASIEAQTYWQVTNPGNKLKKKTRLWAGVVGLESYY